MLVDTVTLRLKNVKYDAPNLKTQSPGVDIRSGEVAPFVDICGHRVNKAYLNTDKFQFTCKAKQLPNGEALPVASVKLSVPKVLGKDAPGVKLDAFDVSDALCIIRESLGENGIYTDTLDAGIWRVDSTVDVISAYPFEAYSPIFENMCYHHFTDASFGSTYRLGGKTKQFCIYDKVAEYKNRGEDTSGMPDNVLRFEYRTLKGRSCRDAGFGDVTALLDKYDVLRARTQEAWDKALFWMDASVLRASPGKYLEVLEEAQGESARWVSRAIKELGYRHLIENGCSPPAFYRYLIACGVSRPTAVKHRKGMIAMQFEQDILALYDELKCKVAEAFAG